MLKKLFLLLFVLSLFISQVISQEYEDVTQEFMTNQSSSLDVNNLNLSFQIDSTTSSILNNSLTQSTQNSMTLSNFLDSQDLLLSQLEQRWMQLDQQVQILESLYNESKVTNQQLETIVQNCKIETQNLKVNVETYKQALLSNKDDTHYIINELSMLLDRLNMLEKRLKRNMILHEIEMPVLFVSGLLFGLGLTKSNPDLIISGLAVFTIFELQYNCGKFLFKVY